MKSKKYIPIWARKLNVEEEVMEEKELYIASKTPKIKAEKTPWYMDLFNYQPNKECK